MEEEGKTRGDTIQGGHQHFRRGPAPEEGVLEPLQGGLDLVRGALVLRQRADEAEDQRQVRRRGGTDADFRRGGRRTVLEFHRPARLERLGPDLHLLDPVELHRAEGAAIV